LRAGQWLWLDSHILLVILRWNFTVGRQRDVGLPPARTAMNRFRLRIYYSGRVQGVGFRYTAKSLATSFEVTGTVRNLLDARVELIAEGEREELDAFRRAIQDSEVGRFIRQEETNWSEATGEHRGFEIVR
jgi:acylphosphatase